MALTDNERKLLEGFEWLRNVHHEVQHRGQIALGHVSPSGCEARTCVYANSVIEWAKAQEAQP